MAIIRCTLVLASLVISLRSLILVKTSVDRADDISIKPQQGDTFRFALDTMVDTNHRCGSYKCYYPLTPSFEATTDQRFGYVAGTDPSLEQSLRTAYDFSISVIRQEFGMKHTALSNMPPEKVALSSRDFVAWLDHNKTGTNDQPRAEVPQFAGHDTAYVQVVQQIDESALFWGTSHSKNSIGMSNLSNWQRQLMGRDESVRKAVLSTFEGCALQLFRLLEAHPCLYDDFQILVQQNGEIVHIDVDRCFWYAKDGKANEKNIADVLFASCAWPEP